MQQVYLKLLRKDSFKKKGESTGDLVGIKIANKITKVSKNYKWGDKEIPKEKYISPEERRKIIDNLSSVILL